MASHMQQKDEGTTTALEISCDDSAMPPQNKNGSLQDSELTIQSEGGSAVSGDETSGWLGAIGSDFRNIASCFKDNIPPVIGGVANLVHQTAMSVAAEIAQLERDGLEEERWKIDQQSNLEDKIYSQPFLPWEIRQQSDVGEPLYRTDEVLKEIILGLSLHENTFLEPYHPGSKGTSSFELHEQRITLIERLLEIDDNLAVMHARFSGRSPVRESEADFWKNYFFHCGKVRKEYLGEHFLHLKHENKQIVDDGTRQNVKKNCRLEDKGLESKHLAQGEFFTNQHSADEFTLDDDESLVPASVTDDSSYVNVIPSAPNSMNTFMTTRSIEDLVVIDRDGENCN